MNKKILFACDIMGTITGALDKEKLDIEYKNLATNLVGLTKEYGADELIFSFFTADSDKSFLFWFVEKIKPYFEGTNVKLGFQFMSNGCYNLHQNLVYNYNYINKPKEIANYANKLQIESNLLSVIYADDNLYEGAINSIQEGTENDIPTYGLKPNDESSESTDNFICSDKRGIIGLNETITILSNNIKQNKSNVKAKILKNK